MYPFSSVNCSLVISATILCQTKQWITILCASVSACILYTKHTICCRNVLTLCKKSRYKRFVSIYSDKNYLPYGIWRKVAFTHFIHLTLDSSYYLMCCLCAWLYYIGDKSIISWNFWFSFAFYDSTYKCWLWLRSSIWQPEFYWNIYYLLWAKKWVLYFYMTSIKTNLIFWMIVETRFIFLVSSYILPRKNDYLLSGFKWYVLLVQWNILISATQDAELDSQ